MDLRTYARALIRNWWIILLACALGIGAALAVTMTTAPRYQSSVTFFVSTPTDADGNALQADQYAPRRVNEKLAQMIITSSGVDLPVGALQSSTSATADLNTVLLTATVTDTTQERSLQIASALATEFGVMVDELENRGSPENANVVLNVISGPTVDPTPVSPRPRTMPAT